MQKIPDRFGLAQLLRRPGLIRDLLRHKEQEINKQYVLPTGEIRRARYGKIDSTVDLGEIITAVSAIPPPPIIVQSNPWSDLAVANGGCVTPVAIQIAEATHQAIAAETFANKVLQLYPFLGCNIISARVPLFDRLGKGLADNYGFVDADFTQSLGIQGDGAKYFDSLVLPSECGVITNTGGMGWIETNIAAGLIGSNPEPTGCYDVTGNNRFSIDLRSTLRGGRWGTTPGGFAGETLAAIDAHYYNQCEAANIRKFWIDGVKKAETTTLVDIVSDRVMSLMGCNAGPLGPQGWSGRGFCAYFTDGTMTDAEVSRFHLLLLRYLVNPKITGVPVPYGGSIPQDTFPDPEAPENEEESECEACVNSILVSRVSGLPLASRVSGKLLQAQT